MNEGAGQVATQYETDEKTEIISISPSQYASRLRGLYVQKSFSSSGPSSEVHLDALVIPPNKDFRLIVRPLSRRPVSHGSQESCEWIPLRTEISPPDEPDEIVLAVTQTPKDVKFTVRMPCDHSADDLVPPLWLELFYDPASDNQILQNRSNVTITVSYLSQTPQPPSPPTAASASSASSPPASSSPTPTPPDDDDDLAPPSTPDLSHQYAVFQDTTRALFPGTWRIHVDAVGVLDVRILERPSLTFFASPPPPPPRLAGGASAALDTQASSGKRSFVADEGDEVGPGPRRPRLSSPVDDKGQDKDQGKDKGKDKDTEPGFMCLASTPGPTVLPPSTTVVAGAEAAGAELATMTDSYPLLSLKKNETIVISGTCEAESYHLTKGDRIASSSLSTVFTGTLDRHPDVPQGDIITVKMINMRPTPARTGRGGAVAEIQAEDSERFKIRQASTWEREFASHGYLRHESIVRLYGGDARHLLLYMEHVDAADLSKKGIWRTDGDFFMGTRQDALRIMREMSGALNYVHARNLVHNDIKPANILFSRERGAVLCDFGLSTSADARTSAGGTPYYVPPEFIGSTQRGPPSDVWALGVTMLYLLRKIPFPEARRHHQVRPLYWQIKDVNEYAGSRPRVRESGGQPGRTSTMDLPALTQMKMWLSEVNHAKERLNQEDIMERLTYAMLTPNRSTRITMKRVVNELFVDRAT